MPWPIPAAMRRYLIVVPRPLLAAPLVVHRRYLIVAPGRCPRHRCALQILDRGALAVARGGARCASKVLHRCARPLPAAPRRYLSVVPRPLPAAAPVVRRGYLIVVPRPLPRASTLSQQEKKTLLMCSGKEQILPVCSVILSGCA